MAKNLEDSLSKIADKLDEVHETTYKIDKEVALQKAAFDDHLRQDERMYEEFKRMNDILQLNTDSLKEHMHRTELLEQLVTKMDARISPFELEKIQKETISQYRKTQLKKIAKILGIIATAIGIVIAAKPLLLKLLVL